MPVMLFGGMRINTPDQIAGCTAWFRAGDETYSDAGVTPAVDTNTVYRWGNKMDANYLDQPTAGFRPTYRTNIVNGQPVIRFGGATDDDYMDSNVALSSWFAVGAKTIFSVHYHSNNVTVNIIGGTNFSYYMNNTGQDLNINNNDGGVDSVTNTAQSPATWTIGTGWHDGTNIKVGVSDTRTASLQSTASGNTTSLADTPRIGATAGPANLMDGDIAELAFFNVALAEDDRQAIERYMAARYNITLPY